MNARLETIEQVPECLKGVLENQINPKEREAISTSIECGTVEDIRVTVPDEIYELLESKLAAINSPTIQEKRASGEEKLPVKFITFPGGVQTEGKKIKITTKEGEEIELTYEESQMSRGLGGGAFNTSTDTAIINKALYEALGMDADQIPKTGLFMTLPKTRQEQVRRDCREFPNLDLNFFTGSPRRSISIKKASNPDEFLFFSTPLGSIEEGEEEPAQVKKPRHIVLHNQPDPRSISDVLKALDREKHDTVLTWSLGSNQISDGIDRYQNHLRHCRALTCNLKEAVSWILTSSDETLSEDPILIENLEALDEPPKNRAQLERLTTLIVKLAVDAGLAVAHFVERDGKTVKFIELRDRLLALDDSIISAEDKKLLEKSIKNLVLPEDLEKRKIVSQRAAQLLSQRMAQRSYVVISDGGNPTTINRTYATSNPETEVQNREHYIPSLDEGRRQKIDDLIKERGHLPTDKDATGCGDCLTGAVVALRQAATSKIQSTTICHIAHHFTYLVFSLPYSNLLEIEANYPGITQAVMNLALEDIDQEESKLHQECRHQTMVNPESTQTSIAKVLGL